MQLFLRLLILAALGFVGWALFHEAALAQSPGAGADATKLIICFVGVIIVAVIGGVIIAGSIIPMLGDYAGSVLFSGFGTVERDPSAEAARLLTQGDYAGAIAAYEALYEKDPADPRALGEIARIYCEHLGSPELAAEVLERALAGEHPAEEGAFLAARLVEVYWDYQRDAIRARQILIQIVAGLPDTKYAAHAQHRLAEIDRAQAAES